MLGLGRKGDGEPGQGADEEEQGEQRQQQCRDAAPADHALCAFVPADNGFFNATVTNAGTQANSYWLLTN